jgi:hypothetical protein
MYCIDTVFRFPYWFFAKIYGLLIAAALFANFEDRREDNGSENEKHISIFQIRSNSLYPNTHVM